MKVVSVRQMQELDKKTIQQIGVPGIVLMENAGRAMVREMKARISWLKQSRVLVCCGKGNNGGDGFVIARHLYNQGIPVSAILLTKKNSLSGDARINADIWRQMGGTTTEILNKKDINRFENILKDVDIVVDALFGTGLKSAPRGIFAEVIERINKRNKYVAAVDIPSGILADSSHFAGPAVKANFTVTFGLPKIGHVIYPAAEFCGDVIVADISIPANLTASASCQAELIDGADCAGFLARRQPDSHKGNYGHLLILAGSPGKTGAAAMAAEAALRMGVGLVTVGVPQSINDLMETKLTEAMTLPLPQTSQGTLAYESREHILSFGNRVTAAALGPGLSLHPETVHLVQRLIGELDIPIIMDADAVSAFSNKQNLLNRKLKSPLAITPHPGEMARLLNLSISDIQKDRLDISKKTAKRLNVWTVLKGARTVVASTNGKCWINTSGNPGMAKGGMGDILTGMLGALAAQNFNFEDVCKTGVFLHGLAADIAAETLPQAYYTAQDLIDFLPDAFDSVTEEKIRIPRIEWS